MIFGAKPLQAVGRDEPDLVRNELRRHVYRQGGTSVRCKIKKANGRWIDFYRVRDDRGNVGWQAKKPDEYRSRGWRIPYVGALDPFDPDHLGEPVAWPEGERDVDMLTRIGMPALTFGSASDVPSVASKLLAGRSVVIMADNDEPGRKCADEKARLLHGHAAAVQVVHFPELPEHGDVSDFIGAGGTLDALYARAELPKPIPKSKPVKVKPENLTASPFAWTDPATIPRREFLYGTHLVRGYISVTVSPGGIGKSSLAIVEALSMVSGKPLLGEAIREPLRVWYFNLEDPADELRRRVMAAALRYGLTEGDFADRLFLNSGRDTELVIADQTRAGIVIAQPLVEALVRTIRENRIDVVVIDPFVSSHRVNENDNGAIDRVAKTWARIAEATGCAIELVHHARKTGGAEVGVEDGRGAGALLAAARSGRVLNPMTEDEAKAAKVERRRLHFRVDNGKSNLAPPPEHSRWFRLASIALGNGTDGGDAVGVVEVWEWPKLFDGIEVAHLRAAQRAISQGVWRADVRSPEWAGIAIGQAIGLDPEKDRDQLKGLLKVWIENSMFKVVTRLDEKRRERAFVEVGELAND